MNEWLLERCIIGKPGTRFICRVWTFLQVLREVTYQIPDGEHFLNSPLTVCRLFRDISSEDGCCGGGPILFPSPLHFLWWPVISMVGLHGKHSGRISRQISRLPSEPDQPSPASPRSGGRTFFRHPCLFSSYIPKSTGNCSQRNPKLWPVGPSS